MIRGETNTSARDSANIGLPLDASASADPSQTLVLTVTVHTGHATAVVPADWEVSFGQLVEAARPEPAPTTPVAPRTIRGGWTLGNARFDSRGDLVELAGLPVSGPRLDVWRAPTENDTAGPARSWRALGLDWVRHRHVSVQEHENALVVTSMTMAAGTDAGFSTQITWTATTTGGVHLHAEVAPIGQFGLALDRVPYSEAEFVTLPRIGLRLGLPAGAAVLEWFGLGPGKSYPDSSKAARFGRHSASVSDLQTPYVVPQENGLRSDVRRARLAWNDGRSIDIASPDGIGLTVRPWPSEALTSARHPTDLVESDRTWLNLDAAQNGLGTATCGPDTFTSHRLHPRNRTFSVDLG
ncbi:hypothetical protein [Streptomyces sp. NPDC058463]|uniref:hypothetical protein n=1 Tax=Streptomyces sp. NPDC058463 TaxID=3346510 RepID=UPI00366636B8